MRSTKLVALAALALGAASFAAAQSPLKAYQRVGNSPWSPAAVELRNGVAVFHLDPGRLRSGQVMLLIDPPPHLAINDMKPPQLRAISIDGKALPPQPDVNLGVSGIAPKRITLTFDDADNAPEASSFLAALDGEPLRVRAAMLPGQKAQASLRLPDVEYGEHTIAYQIADNSPQSNILSGRIRFARFDPTDYALAAHGATVKVDSSFAGYESLASLNDGVSKLSGDSCGSDVTWASAETPAEHWAEVTLARPEKLKEVTVTWAYYTDVCHASRHVEIQVPDGAGWRTLYRSPAGGEAAKRTTTFSFPELITQRFRIWQPAGGGSSGRPNLLWIAEIEAR